MAEVVVEVVVVVVLLVVVVVVPPVVVVVVVVPPDEVPEKVEPIGPYLMFEYTTYAFGLLFSTSVGAPEVVEQFPRATPGVVGSAVVG